MLNSLVKDFKANVPINMLANKYKMPGYLVIATLGALTLEDNNMQEFDKIIENLETKGN